MVSNSRELKVISSAEEKKDPYKKDVIYDPMGQWKYPGQVTKIPDRNITMKGVPYPVLGIDDLGNKQMMYPEMEYVFPGNTVTEYPQMAFGGKYSKTGTHMQEGGWLDAYQDGGDPSISYINHDFNEESFKRGGSYNPLQRSRSPRSKTNKNIQSSINKIFLRNSDLYGPGGRNIYEPKKHNWLDKYK